MNLLSLIALIKQTSRKSYHCTNFNRFSFEVRFIDNFVCFGSIFDADTVYFITINTTINA